MTRQMFSKMLGDLIAEPENTSIPAWITWVEECVDSGQYVAFIEKPRDEAVEVWLDSYYMVLSAITQEHGADATRRVVDLACVRLCLYPFEMEEAARLLCAGATTEEIIERMLDGLLEREDLWPMCSGYDGSGELPPIPTPEQH